MRMAARTGQFQSDERLALLRVTVQRVILQLSCDHHLFSREEIVALSVREDPSDLNNNNM